MIWITIALLIGLLALSIPIAAALAALGLTLDYFYSFLPLRLALGEMSWGVSTDFILFAIPLFVLLGELLLRSGIAERMYGAMSQWLSWLPGGLMLSNIGPCTLFAAVSGSSVATAATIGTVAVGEIERHGYNERLFLGTIAAGGTLGILIPPSIVMIVYGALTETSIPQLYLAGIIPGLVLAGFFMITVIIACVWRPAWGGDKIAISWGQRWSTLPDLGPPLIIFVVVIGSIYSGLATPTESAALGVLMALVLAGWKGRLTATMLREALEGTMRTTAMIMLILIAATFLSFVVTSVGIGRQVTELITDSGLTPMQTMWMIVGLYLVLGMFMESLSMMIATVPIITPVVISMGFDPIWFGVLMMLLLETALITPPVGLNLFIVQGVRTKGQIRDVMIGSFPFVVAMLAMIVVLVLYPDLAMWLPNNVGR
ncbi:MAG: TRAP transporter large permease [Thalassobaculum sp.]|uniref:TRAP transporter large permease n=1 Tax=Thalassobaculum sp. TaxID=2022740 RepID=UPI0032EF896F